MKRVKRGAVLLFSMLLVAVGLSFISPLGAQSAEAATVSRIIPSGFQAYQDYVDVTGNSTWYLQRKTASGAWVTVNHAKVTSKHELHFKLLVAKKSVLHPKSITYREYVPEGGGYREYVGAPYTIRYENPRSYTGVKKKYYAMLKSHCPDVTIRISASQEPTATGDESVAYYRVWYNQIVVEPNMPTYEQKTTMLHECAHHFQDIAYSKGNYGDENVSKLDAQAAKAYHTSQALGLEYNADCVAQIWGGKYRAYEGPCNTAGELKAAHRIAAKETIY